MPGFNGDLGFVDKVEYSSVDYWRFSTPEKTIHINSQFVKIPMCNNSSDQVCAHAARTVRT